MWLTIKNVFIAHWQIKLLALAIAVAVWFYGNTRLKEDAVLLVPVRIEMPEGYRLLYQSDNYVQIRLAGPQRLTQQRQDEARQGYLQINARLTEEDVEVGRMKMEVDPGWLNIPGSDLMIMNVTVLDPAEIEFYADRIVRRTLPVEATLTGRPRDGYRVTDHTVTPSEISVEGPSLALDKNGSVRTHTIPLWDAQESFRRYVPLVKDQEVNLAEDIRISVSYSTSPSQVAVHISVDMEHSEVEMEDVPVKLLRPIDFPYEAEIDADDAYVSVVISGMPDNVENLTFDDISAYIDLSGFEDEDIAPGSTSPYKEEVNIVLRSGVDANVESVTPEELTVLLSNN